jgi:hypothetical protein
MADLLLAAKWAEWRIQNNFILKEFTMKDFLRILGTVVLAVTLIFGMMACGDPGGGGGGGEDDGTFPDLPPLLTDPALWTVITTPLINDATVNTWVWEIAAGKGHFVAVGGSSDNGGTIRDNTWLVKRSRNGIEWTDVRGSFDRELRVVAYGGGTFVATDVGDYKLGISTPPAAHEMRSRIFYSRDDGLNWTGPITLPLPQIWAILGLVHGDTGGTYGTWLAIGQYGAVAKSIDGGASWTMLNPIGLPRGEITEDFNNVSNAELTRSGIPLVNNPSMTADTVYPALKAGVYVKETGTWYLGGDFGLIASSQDLENWTVYRARDPNITRDQGLLYTPLLNASSYFITKMIYFEGALHAIGSAPNVYSVLDLTSTGSNWTEGSSTVREQFGANDAGNIVSGNGTMVIVGSGGRAIYRSVAGWSEGEWMGADELGSGQTWVNGLTYAGGIWVAGLRGGQIAYANIRVAGN